MVDLIKTKLSTNPTPVTLTVVPKVVGSTKVQLQLNPIPSYTITSTPEGSGWEKFNAEVSQHMITTVGNALITAVTPLIQTAAQNYLNEHVAFNVPSIPVTVHDVSITLTPSDLNISTHDDHVMITGQVAIT